jgi:hypothetical protein
VAPPTTLVSVSSASVAAGGSPAGGSRFGTGTPTGADGAVFSGGGESVGSGVVAAGPWGPKAGAGAVGLREESGLSGFCGRGRPLRQLPVPGGGRTPREAAAVVVPRRAVVASCGHSTARRGQRTEGRRRPCGRRAGAISMATTGTSATVALAPISPSLPRPPRAIERRNGQSDDVDRGDAAANVLKPRRQVAASTEGASRPLHAQLELIGDLRVGDPATRAGGCPALALGKLREPVTERLEPLAPLVAGRLGAASSSMSSTSWVTAVRRPLDRRVPGRR